ncbi:MAG: bifunctional hydroxymethylpyrimidine kinase/phosphomethylpyrimidine kinase [Acidobacteria bacterium]|nr:bifunctional hydroxymethylpyrimidine kinase/phosphomethylpyrimidine kinase [Acidobacteriota bacterium]
MKPIALTIAGSDPSGGAGVQADLKTFHQFGVYGEAVLTLITVQNTKAVTRVEYLDAALVREQLDAVIADIPPGAAKTGALGSAAVIHTLAEAAARFRFPLVVDPVMLSRHGTPLLEDAALGALRDRLLPRASLLTPNLEEAATLAGIAVDSTADMRSAAKRLHELGAYAVLVKGGHLRDAPTDVLFCDGKIYEFAAPRIDTRHTHGTGCTYSAAITAELAKGVDMVEAVRRAKEFMTEAIRTSPGLGSGAGPINHHARA